MALIQLLVGHRCQYDAEAIRFRHDDIQQNDEAALARTHDRQRIDAIIGLGDGVTSGFERLAKDYAADGVIIDNEHMHSVITPQESVMPGDWPRFRSLRSVRQTHSVFFDHNG